METKYLVPWVAAALFSITAQVRSEEQGVDVARIEPAILYGAIAWGNAVDYGSILVPLRAYASLVACDAAKKKMMDSSSEENSKRPNVQCSLARTSDEKAVARMLMENAREESR